MRRPSVCCRQERSKNNKCIFKGSKKRRKEPAFFAVSSSIYPLSVKIKSSCHISCFVSQVPPCQASGRLRSHIHQRFQKAFLKAQPPQRYTKAASDIGFPASGWKNCRFQGQGPGIIYPEVPSMSLDCRVFLWINCAKSR